MVNRKYIEDPDFLSECLEYFPESGLLIWRNRPLSHFKNSHGRNSFNSRFCGKEAGTKQFRRGGQRHHLCFDIGRQGVCSKITAHKAIAIMFRLGIEDGKDVDHKNGDPFDNRLDNLRIVSKSGSSMNRGLFRRGGVARTLPKGVNCVRGRFLARIRFNRELIYLGSFDTAKEASLAYEKKASELFGEFYRKAS